MPTVYLGIGSNLGNRQNNCEKSLSLLEEKGITIIKRSSMIETEPWGVQDQPKFINLVVEIQTELEPGELFCTLKEIEVAIGRTETVRWGPRIVDLDILFYNDAIINSSELIIPHPGIQDRIFVLKPLSEIAPDKMHPVLKKSVRELFQEREKKVKGKVKGVSP
jgi:2-amino-4-hydroxy-6-hydroxymethyldihydropteridine diphosphokinase